MKCFCFLRAINIGKVNRVKMDAFREFFAEIGMEQCKSYIQSGNFILTGDPKLMHEQMLADEMRSKLAIETVVFLRNETQYQAIIDECPYAEVANINPKRTLVTFFQKSINLNKIAILQEKISDSARIYVSNTELYTHLVTDQQIGHFSNNALEKLFQLHATTRNWSSILKMRQLQYQ